jgi:hypothetical protein
MGCFHEIHEQAGLDVTIQSVLPVGVALEDVARAYPAQAPKMAVRSHGPKKAWTRLPSARGRVESAHHL